MAYSLYEKPYVKTIQYYPEEHDYSDYYKGARNIDIPVTSTKKFRNTLPSIEYENERKCPIYIHQFNKMANLSMYNNYSPRNSFTVEKPPQLKKIKQRNPKLMLDQLEETYWATWKPNKEVKPTRNIKMRPEKEVKPDFKRRDLSDHLIKYFTASDFPTSSGSVLGGVETSSNRLEFSINQEIQTDYVPPMILENTERTESIISVPKKGNSDIISGENSQEETLGDSKESQETVLQDGVKSSETIVKEDKVENNNALVESPRKTGKKFLKHTDSFILHKKKQDEVKEDVQQPRCIKLYKKTTSTFLKGGSYPLKSCMKKVTSEKGNFRLGAPGSPLFITSSSFNKKYSR